MPKPSLREPFATIASDLIETLLGGLKEWRADLSYPESHSDMKGCVMAVLRKYDVKLRPVPLDRSEVEEPPRVCLVCRQPMNGGHLFELARQNGREQLAHIECVVTPGRKP